MANNPKSIAFSVEERKFQVAQETLVATKVYAGNCTPTQVISFHGFGATASRARIRYVLDYLALHGISSACFDFSGNGDSSGTLAQATLRSRLAEAFAATEALSGGSGLALIGTSMGGFLAASLIPQILPRHLILFCPAAYSRSALDFNLDDKFPANARRFSIEECPAFEALSMFTGHLLIITASEDSIVTQPMIDAYLRSAACAATKKIIHIAGADHKIHAWLDQHSAERSQILGEILHFIQQQ